MTQHDDDLDDLFAVARRAGPVPDAALVGRIATDAARLQTRGWASLWKAVGGWPAVAGFVAAGLAGVWIGSVGPEPLEAVIGLQSYDMADLMPGFAQWGEPG